MTKVTAFARTNNEEIDWIRYVIGLDRLTDTLRHLEQCGIVNRQVFPTVPVSVEYSLTESGREYGKVLLQMRQWGEKWMMQPLQHAGDSV
ncbi:winged helix-turn-helix transcriptional regulator [Cohnella sp. NL03-T5]|nr:winged helix-turn-helix transcriptional regulator [Cohnella silvisoli]